MLPVFQNSANPEMAFQHFTEFCKAYAQKLNQKFIPHDHNENLLRIFGNSQFMSLFLIRNPQMADEYSKSSYQNQKKPREIFKKEILNAIQNQENFIDQIKALKLYKYKEYLRLTLKEITGGNQAAIYNEFSYLAYEITNWVFEEILKSLCEHYKINKNNLCDYAIIAMGKLGGFELNYSSDIDLIGLYENEHDFDTITNQELFAKAFAKLGQVLSTKNEDGFLFRVDWDLRPEGKAGTLANSLKAMETYYQTFGEEWERQAFLKAQVLLENKNLGQRFCLMMTPFVYRKSFDLTTIAKIRDIKFRMMSEIKSQNLAGIDIKKSSGCIRDIEFLVQGHQLLYGGKHTKIRLTNTAKTLDALQELKIFSKEKTKVLKDAYFYFRKIESCIQMDQEQQTHWLKPELEFRFKIAKRMLNSLSKNEPVNDLNKKLKHYQNQIQKLFDEFYQQ